MKIMKIYEKAWIIAIAVALIVSVVNLIRFKEINQAVYFPVVIAFFCVMVYMTKKNHRKFMDKFEQDNRDNLL